MSSLFLRRISVNGSPQDSPDANSTDNIISLESKRTTFGKSLLNDVLLVEGSEGNEFDSRAAYVYRKHAHIIRSVTITDTLTWTLYDHSESGTYVDGERVTKNVPKVLQAQSVVIFGHEKLAKGAEKPGPGSSFVFRVETTEFHQGVVARLVELSDHQLKVFSKAMIIKDMGARPNQTVTVGKTSTIVPQKTGVQQREADSSTMTAISELPNGRNESLPSTSSASSSSASAESPESAASTSSATTGPEATSSTTSTIADDAPRTSAFSRANVDHGNQPSTSYSCDGLEIDNIPARAPLTNFADPQNLARVSFLGTVSHLEELLGAQTGELLERLPDLKPAATILRDLLNQNLTCGQTIAAGKEIYIVDFCSQPELRNDPQAQLILAKKKELAECMASYEERYGVLMQSYVEQARILRGFNHVVSQNPFTPSPRSAFRATGHQPPDATMIHRPRPVNPYLDPMAYLRMLFETNAEQQRLLPHLLRMESGREEMIRQQHNPQQPIPASELMLRVIQSASFRSYENQMQIPASQPGTHEGNYLAGLHRQLEMVPVAQQHGGVIARAPGRRNVTEVEVDEERHSASSGSTTADHNYAAGRRRTASEESEIVDVVGVEDDKDVTTPEKNPAAEDAEEDETNSSTPRIDAQSTPSAVVSATPSALQSAVQTPLSSPVPKKTTPLSSPKVAEVAPTPAPPASTSTPAAPAPVSPASEAPAPPTTAPEASPSESSETVQRKVDENVASIKATMSVVAKASTSASTSTPTAVTASVAVTVAAPPSDPKKKTPPSKERRLKQLDDASSADSESEDDESKAKKKKPRRSVNTPRRPGRGGGATGRKRKSAAAAPATDDVEGSDDVAADAASDTGVKQTPSKSGRRRAPAAGRQPIGENGGDSAPTSRRRKRQDADESGADETPARRRRVAKFQKTNNDNSAAASPATGAEDGDKEKCGVAKTHCLCKRWEKKRDLQWVSCAICEQWFHVWCVRLNNNSYGIDDVFQCCGDNPSPEAIQCLSGAVFADYKTRRIKPQMLSSD